MCSQDGQGRVVDFRNTVIVMTSNLGAAHLNAAPTTSGGVAPETKALVMGAIQAHWPPEFINRIDEIVIFVSAEPSFTVASKLIVFAALTHSGEREGDCGCAPQGGRRTTC